MIAARITFSDPTRTREREQHIDAHQRYLRSGELKILQSGPFKGSASTLSGALVVAEVNSLEELVAFSERDPFVVAGVYKKIHIVEWTVTLTNE